MIIVHCIALVCDGVLYFYLFGD